MLTPAKKAQIERLLVQGDLSACQIAEETEVSIATVRKTQQRLKMNPGRQKPNFKATHMPTNEEITAECSKMREVKLERLAKNTVEKAKTPGAIRTYGDYRRGGTGQVVIYEPR